MLDDVLDRRLSQTEQREELCVWSRMRVVAVRLERETVNRDLVWV